MNSHVSTFFVNFSVLLNGVHIAAYAEISIWNFVSFLLVASLLGLWGFSAYLEFDSTFVLFGFRLVSFLFCVWSVLSSCGNFTFLLFWEIVGIVSFLLISTFQNRTSTVSSAFAAIGFNRLGDISLILLQISICVLPFRNSTFVIFLFFALLLKSVNFVTFLWLPEAMEGPTPVSSLLHSATLVMAGLFSFYAFGVTSTISWIWFSLFGFVCVILLSRSEKDVKRTVAVSTVILVSFLWLLFSLSLSETTVVICTIHAGYKSAFFLNCGKILSKFSVYSDNIGISSSSKSFLPVVGIFLIGLKTSAYSAQKHAVDGISVDGIGFLISVLISIGTLAIWLITLKINSAKKSTLGISFFDLHVFLMTLTILALSCGILGQGGNVATSTFIFWIPFLKIVSTQTFLNCGSITISSGVNSVLISKYEFLKIGILKWKTVNTEIYLLFSFVGIFFLILI